MRSRSPAGLYLPVLAASGGYERGALLIETRPAVMAALTQSHFGIPWMVGLRAVALTALGSARRGYAAWLLEAASAVVYAELSKSIATVPLRLTPIRPSVVLLAWWYLPFR
jgi:hypothetical protein